MQASDLTSEAEDRLQTLRKAKSELLLRLGKSPEGKIHVVHSGNRTQYYLRKSASDKSGEYLAKHKQKTIQIYLQKAYDEKMIKKIDREIAVLEKFVKGYRDLPEQLRDVYSHLPKPVKEYVKPMDLNDDDFAERWNDAFFVPKRMLAEGSHFTTDRGENVRSKSELYIANTLNRLRIPYKYECPLELRKGLTIYPDFTVLHVKKRSVYYWEHRGKMDDQEYARHAVSRLREYGKAGIFPGKKLIITEETATDPLSTREILSIIQTYFIM